MQKNGPNEIGKAINDMLNAAPPAGPSPGVAPDELYLGLTLFAFLLACFFSLVGIVYVMYAKKQGRLIIGICGAGLMIFTYFISNQWLILLIGLLLSFLPTILKRFNIDM